MRFLTVLLLATTLIRGTSGSEVDNLLADGMIDSFALDSGDAPSVGSCDDGVSCYGCPTCGSAGGFSSASGLTSIRDLSWLDSVKVGYDKGFVIASEREQNLQTSKFPFRLKLNGWGQLRHTILDSNGPNRDINQFQLKRGRLAWSGCAFDPNVTYFIQIDGRSSSGDDIRLLDYYLSYDFGHSGLGLRRGSLGFRTGKYKMPFTRARWMSGQQFEFTDRSMASTFFDVNRSFGWGLYGDTDSFLFPVGWEAALFNGLVTGGAETGSSGTLDNNFAYSARIQGFPIGDWGEGSLADFDWHQSLAMRVGAGVALTTIDQTGTTEFNRLRVVDSGATLSSILPQSVLSYDVDLFCVDASFKRRGWSTTLEYYFRNVSHFRGSSVPDVFDHGFWFQLGYFAIPQKLQLLARWSRVVGDSGTLGVKNESSDEIAAGLAYYFRRNQHAKFVLDVTHLNGAPIDSAALDIFPGEDGWLLRSQIQFSF